MGRWPYLLVVAAWILSGCERTKQTEAFTGNIGCTAASALERLEPGPGVEFISDKDGADAAVMAAWRESVGPPVADRSGRSCEALPLDSLLIVSWNVHIGHADIRRFVSDLRGGRIVPGKRVRHFVLLLQEAYRAGGDVPAGVADRGVCPSRMGGDGPDIEDIADSLGLALYYVPSMRNGCEAGGVRQDRGNAILSTLPLTKLKAIELPLMRQRRVVAVAEVKGHNTAGGEWTLSLASVHLENRGPGNPRDWVAGRARQARALVSALPESNLAVVGGDFNTLTGPHEPAVRIVGARFRNTPEPPAGITYVSYAVMRSHLDYLFFQCAGRHRTKYWRARERYGSDHYPVMGFVRLAESNEVPAASARP